MWSFRSTGLQFERENTGFSFLCVCVCSVTSVVFSLGTPRIVAPLSMQFPRQEHQSGLPCLPPGDLSCPGIKPMFSESTALLVDSLPLSHWGKPSFLFVCAKLLQQFPTLCDPVDFSLPGSSVHNIFQVKLLKWVAMPSSTGSSRPRDQTCVSYISCIGRRVLYQEHHLGNPPFYKKRFCKSTETKASSSIDWLRDGLYKILPKGSQAVHFQDQPQGQLSPEIKSSPISKNDHIHIRMKTSHLVMLYIESTLQLVAKINESFVKEQNIFM